LRHSQNHTSRPWIPLILLVVVAVGFFVPFSRSQFIGILIKGVLFIAVFVLIYGLFYRSGRADIRSKRVEAESEVDDQIKDDESDQQWIGFGKAFRQYYQEFLEIVRQAFVASGAAFYLKRGSQDLEFQIGITEQDCFDQKMLVQANSLASHVMDRKHSFIEGRLALGTHLTGIQGFEIRSFLGTPLIWNKEIVGVLAIGSDTEDNFSEDDQTFLERCADLLTQMMMVYRQGLRWEIEQKIYQVHLNAEKAVQDAPDEENAILAFVEQVKQLFHFDRFTFCVKEGEQGVIRFVVGQIDDLDRGETFPLDDGLNGWILKRGSTKIVEDLSASQVARPRYHKSERQDHGLRSFIGIPLIRENETWGCITLESQKDSQYGEWTQKVLCNLIMHLQTTIERIQLMEQMRSLGQSKLSSDTIQLQID